MTANQATTPPLVLASSSPYRRQLLERLGLIFTAASPDIDETVLPGESAEPLVIRLASAKASALATQHTEHLIIGSDQVASLDGDILTKPLTTENAIAQLGRCSGRSVTFLTGLCLLNTATGWQRTICEPFRVQFRQLETREICAYIKKEQPLDCAGSFRMEGLGIALFESLDGRDPNSLIGLPLIALCDLLRQQGINPLLA